MKYFSKYISVAFRTLLLVSLATGCSDDDISAPTDRLVVAPEESSVTLAIGGSSTVDIVVTRPVGFAGPVTLTADNLPSGVTASFEPATLEDDVTTSTLTLAAVAGAPNGTSTVAVRADASGLESQEASISVTISTAGPGSFTMTVSPSSISVAQGGSTSAMVSIVRSGGFDAAIALDVGGFPSGIVALASPSSTSANTASINISVGASVPGGTYSAIVTATATGAASQLASISVTVLPALRQ